MWAPLANQNMDVIFNRSANIVLGQNAKDIYRERIAFYYYMQGLNSKKLKEYINAKKISYYQILMVTEKARIDEPGFKEAVLTDIQTRLDELIISPGKLKKLLETG